MDACRPTATYSRLRAFAYDLWRIRHTTRGGPMLNNTMARVDQSSECAAQIY
ncbi:hypothetical protein [Streptomyces sp. NPDC020917]|uniref:hypothetical protein n=1 Tax=Streptomyces sp. NPDC020917 TaxID=3365102 RepID=UPI0037AAC497